MSFLNVLKKMRNENTPVIIYGAGNIANALLEIFERMRLNLNIMGCAVSNNVNEREYLHNIPVKRIEAYLEYKNTANVFIAVIDKYIPEILQTLKNYGFINKTLLSFESDNLEDLRINYFENNSDVLTVGFRQVNLFLKDIVCNESRAPKIYMACSHNDKKLASEFNPKDTDYLIPIQVGKAFTDKSIAAVHDDGGDNISYKNKAYSELTALYWIWKNVKADWVGLCHYRRHFDLSFEDIAKIPNLSVDVILTTPILNYPNVKDVYVRDHEKRDWDNMTEILNKAYPQYATEAEKFFNGEYYSAYNMIITKKRILDEYCSWLFPLLEEIEGYNVRHYDDYQRRYVGFLAERLFSLYFLSGINDFRVMFVRKHFYM